MADIGSISMVSYYNPLAIYRQQQQSSGQQPLSQHVNQNGQAQQAQQNAATSPPDGGQQYWYGYPHGYPHAAHHQSAGPQQYLDHADVLPGWPHHHAHHYSHFQYQNHQAYHHHHAQQQQQQQQSSQINGVVNDWSGDEGNPAVVAGQPSPPITVSGSEISNPGTPTTPPSNNNNNSNNNRNNTINNNDNITVNNNNNPNATPMRPAQVRSPYEWMKKTSYNSIPNPACNITANCNDTPGQAIHEICILDAFGKTRTKDKYRVVYTDHQRLELEKEFHYNRYITMRRKAELALNLALSERQVKIWFQNRRAKQRKQMKKREELEQKESKLLDGIPNGAMAALNIDGIPHGAMAALTLGGMGGMSGMGGMHAGLMHNNGGSSPLGIAHSAAHSLTHGPSSLHAHSHQHAPSHTVLGL